jgi:hypothetical protein
MADDVEDKNKQAEPDTVRFVFQKGRHHRTFHADGAWAAISPQLEVQFSFFSNLRPLPDFTVHTVNEGGDLEEISRQLSQNIIRETNVTVVMPKEGVVSLIQLLQRMVTQIDGHIEEAKKAAAKKPKTTESSEVSN